jgi:signal transduction histidine kinase
MYAMRWWHVGVLATTGVLTVIVVATHEVTSRDLLGILALAFFVVAWFAYGWRFETSPRAAVFIVATCLVITPLAVLASPTFTTMQALVFPIVWSAIRSLRISIIVSVALSTVIGAALYVRLGADAGALLQAVVIESLSLAFSIALGLWMTSISVQSNERARLLAELQAAQSELAALNMDAGITSERERLAREIHDTIAQDLTGLVLLAQRASRELQAGDTAATGERLQLLEEGARTALAETRALVASTAPPSLESGGIGASLERLGTRYERETSIAVTVRADIGELVDRDLEVVLLRCAQEGLANVRKHSRASAASITLTAEPGELRLQITDNGAGFDPEARSSGYGLSGMRERLALVGGTLDVASGADGTSLLIILPAGGTE